MELFETIGLPLVKSEKPSVPATEGPWALWTSMLRSGASQQRFLHRVWIAKYDTFDLQQQSRYFQFEALHI